jgi:hypothetical protein
MKTPFIKTNGNLIFKAALIIMMFIPANLAAQVNFSGNWTFNESKSTINADGPRFEAKALIVQQQGNDLIIERTQPSFDGNEVKLNEKFTLDGKESINKGMMESQTKSLLTWSGENKILNFKNAITFNMDGQSFEINSTEEWSLSEDSKTLMIKSVVNSPMGEMSTTLVYDKNQ